MKKTINMLKIILDVTNEETYKESLWELFEFDEKAAAASFDKHYQFGVGVNIEEVVKDAFDLDFIESYGYQLHDLGNKEVLLVVAWKDK